MVVDNTARFRMDPDVPLVVPEINPSKIGTNGGIIANPNCSTIIMAVRPLNIEFEGEVSPAEAYKVLANVQRIEILKDRANNRWPMPVDASGNDPVFVGRIRKYVSRPNTLDLWVVGDQIRKGAALNAVQIAEHLV